jgi:uncharacterized protein YbaP (TraB family)
MQTTQHSILSKLLWKISGKEIQRPSYLFALHELMDQNSINNFDEINHIMSETDILFCETNTNIDPFLMQMKIDQYCMLADTTLKELYTPEEYSFLDSEIRQMTGTGMTQLRIMKPMFITNLLIVQVVAQTLGIINQPVSVSELFQKTAQQCNKKTIGFETIDERMDNLFNKIPIERQTAILLDTIKNKQAIIEKQQNIAIAYKNEDWDAIEKANANKVATMLSEEIDTIITQRTKMWASTLKDAMKNQSCFVAVGYPHLTGEKGLIALLQNEGYTVESVTL